MHKNAYQAKTLIGNWHENRFTEDYNELDNKTSNTYIKNPSHNKYVPISSAIGNKSEYEKKQFGSATQNVINFQTSMPACETFKTTAQISFNGLEDRKDPFTLKDTSLTKDAAALAEYRATWSGSNHNFSRSYMGAAPYKKSQQE